MTPARLRRLVGFAVVCEALSEAVSRGVIPLFLVKGGAAIELRLGLLARATRDLDIGLCAPVAELLSVFDRALSVGFNDFQFRRKGAARVIGNDVFGLEVAVDYLGRPWATIPVDLGPATQDAQTESVPPISLRELGLTEPRGVPCPAIAEQVAQKVHALSEPYTEGRTNPRARDILDILLLVQRANVEFSAVRVSCERIFAERATHPWPIFNFVFPLDWTVTLGNLARDAGYETDDVRVIALRFNDFLACVRGASTSK
jgi:hypothetical protein